MKRPLIICAIALCLSCDSRTREPTTLPLESCVLETVSLRATCGTLTVPEDRAAPAGRTIDLNIAVVESLAEEPESDPLFILVGGPGQSATHSGASLARAFHDVRKRRDIVLVDQRGTGKSNPLRCASASSQTLDEMLRGDTDPAMVQECLEELDADTRHYATPTAMDDLDAVRAALGYDQINLWGGSYGTRAALSYMRQYPDRTRRVILDGVAPTDIKLTVHAGRDGQRALDLMFERCSEDDACRARFGDLRERFEALRGELGETPRDVSFRHPRTGDIERLTLDANGFAAVVRGILYAPALVATLPLVLERAEQGEWGPLFAAFLSIQDNVDSDFADGMFLSVVCAEDVPQITEEDRRQLADNFVGDHPVELLKRACSGWPTATLPPAYLEPVVTTHPTLILSGELDPVTPPSWGELVAGRLPHATHHVVEGLGHGVSGMPCATKAIARFLDASDPEAVEVDCDVRGFTPLLVEPSGARR